MNVSILDRFSSIQCRCFESAFNKSSKFCSSVVYLVSSVMITTNVSAAGSIQTSGAISSINNTITTITFSILPPPDHALPNYSERGIPGCLLPGPVAGSIKGAGECPPVSFSVAPTQWQVVKSYRWKFRILIKKAEFVSICKHLIKGRRWGGVGVGAYSIKKIGGSGLDHLFLTSATFKLVQYLWKSFNNNFQIQGPVHKQSNNYAIRLGIWGGYAALS